MAERMSEQPQQAVKQPGGKTKQYNDARPEAQRALGALWLPAGIGIWLTLLDLSSDTDMKGHKGRRGSTSFL